jgi:hypothetical protein
MIRKTSSGWQVMSADGKTPLSDTDLSRREAEKKQDEIGKRQPSLIWARERGKLVKED